MALRRDAGSSCSVHEELSGDALSPPFDDTLTLLDFARDDGGDWLDLASS